ncbi:hypothetical protein IMZ48_14915 [Candidatus Bathyarchaeota archaeon]|nr:hypothetical protein [Candidatus Bathyarchaeota archaeon]
MHLHTLIVAALAATAAAALDKTNISDLTCGGTEYSAKQVELAVAEGCRLAEANKTVGANNYPHTFNNRENLSFSASGPYQEFPIVAEGKFGGSAKRSITSKAGKGKGKTQNNSEWQELPSPLPRCLSPLRDAFLPFRDAVRGCLLTRPAVDNPGADRVVFKPALSGNCEYVGAMTHTGAEGNSFVECEAGEESAGTAVAPAWFLAAASGLAAYWALGM